MEAPAEDEILYFSVDPEWALEGLDGPASNFSRLRTEPSAQGSKRKHSETVLLEKLIRKGSKPVKKEYLRIQLIRGHKKCLRQLKTSSPSSTSYFNQKLRELYDAHRRLFTKLISPNSGPLTDGPHRDEKPRTVQKTWNNASCTQYFQHPAVRESFYYYTENIFDGMCPVKLGEYFKARCCDQLVHSEECTDLWTQIKHFVQVGLFQELKLPYFQPYSESGLEWTEACLSFCCPNS